MGKQAANKTQFQKGNKIGPRFRKGKSGNPKGRPRIPSVTAELRKMLGEEVEVGSNRWLAVRRAVAEALLAGALKGDPRALREFLDRTDGAVLKSVEHSGSISGEVTIRVVYDDDGTTPEATP